MNSHIFPSEQLLCSAKILIIDDEAGDIRALEWALRQAQFTNFRSLTDPTRARAEFGQFEPDIVLLDLNMPVMDGFAILGQLRELVPAGEFLPVLILTGENTSEMRNKALAAGASDFLSKPIDCSEVTLRIKNLLQTRFLHRQARKIQEQLDALAPVRSPGAQSKPGENQ
jgi:putative two-component system response regulator